MRTGKNRGIYSRRWKSGKVMWYVRCVMNGKRKRFGPYDNRSFAKKMYYRMRTLDAVGMPPPGNHAGSNIPALHNTMIELGSCIYFLQSGSGGPIKIGYSAQLPKRLKAIHAINGEPIHFLGAIAGTRAEESQIHERYRRERLHGEWFSLSQRLALFLVSSGMKPTMCIEATPELLKDAN